MEGQAVGGNLTEGENALAPAPEQCGPAGWFARVKADRRLPLAAVSIARLMMDGRPRSLVEFADESGFSLRQTPEAIKRLEAAGHVRVIRSKGGPGRKNRVLLIHGGAQ
jgi:hypothetical protein